MRKIIFFTIIFLLCIFLLLITSKKSNLLPVFDEEYDYYDMYILDLSKENINTKNILNYFDNMKIIEMYPYINPIYKNVIKLSNYKFNVVLSNKKNISLFLNEYLKKLEENSLKEEIIKYSINGIKINKIKVYASKKNINNLINNYKIILNK